MTNTQSTAEVEELKKKLIDEQLDYIEVQDENEQLKQQLKSSQDDVERLKSQLCKENDLTSSDKHVIMSSKVTDSPNLLKSPTLSSIDKLREWIDSIRYLTRRHDTIKSVYIEGSLLRLEKELLQDNKIKDDGHTYISSNSQEVKR